MQSTIERHVLAFKQPAGTSRGVYTTRTLWLVRLQHGGRCGVGECAPLPQLSCDDVPNYEQLLRGFCAQVERTGQLPPGIERYPSMQFGIECALRQLQAPHPAVMWDTPFARGQEPIPINGLVWMGSHQQMLERLEQKLSQGFACVKLKVGAIGWEQELDLIGRIRQRFGPGTVQLRLDANGGFAPGQAMQRLEQIAPLGIHSIEQPVMAGQWSEMARLCSESPVPIALDEELIGAVTRQQRVQLLDALRPAHIVLKPSLHGGVAGTLEWIALARERGIGSWITSALESNIGLDAIAQLAAHAYGPGITFPQGLGTGQLYTSNFASALHLQADRLWRKA